MKFVVLFFAIVAFLLALVTAASVYYVVTQMDGGAVLLDLTDDGEVPEVIEIDSAIIDSTVD